MKDYTTIGALNRRLTLRKYVKKIPGIKTSEDRAFAKAQARKVGEGFISALKTGGSNVAYNYGGLYDVKYGGKKR